MVSSDKAQTEEIQNKQESTEKSNAIEKNKNILNQNPEELEEGSKTTSFKFKRRSCKTRLRKRQEMEEPNDADIKRETLHGLMELRQLEKRMRGTDPKANKKEAVKEKVKVLDTFTNSKVGKILEDHMNSYVERKLKGEKIEEENEEEDITSAKKFNESKLLTSARFLSDVVEVDLGVESQLENLLELEKLRQQTKDTKNDPLENIAENPYHSFKQNNAGIRPKADLEALKKFRKNQKW